jgi:hypothetical protein
LNENFGSAKDASLNDSGFEIIETLTLGMTVSTDESVEVDTEPRCRFSRESEFTTIVPRTFSEGLALDADSISSLNFTKVGSSSRSMGSSSPMLSLGGVSSQGGLERSGLAPLPLSLSLIFSNKILYRFET